MTVVLYRVDERLIHGQVVVGWGGELHPARYVVVDDELARTAWERELYVLSLPEGTAADFVGVDEARRRLDGWRGSDERTVVLFRSLGSLLRLAEAGDMEGERVNLGGIHHGEGRERVLPYLHLDADDRERLRRLEGLGVEVSARELPGSPRVAAGDLLETS